MASALNALIEALSTGGDLLVARGELRGLAEQQIDLLVERRFPGLDEGGKAVLRKMASQMIDSTDGIEDTPVGQDIPLDQIPINEHLFGDDWAGKRVQWTGRFSPDKGESWYDIKIDSPDTMTYQELLDRIVSLALDYMTDSPNAFGLGEDELPNTILTQITTQVRRY